MNQDKEDKAIEDYLAGDSAESRRYAELGDEVPPPELDVKILASAERELKVTGIDSRRAPPFKAFAWAAIVVVSFSLVLNIVFQQAVQDPAERLEEMAVREDAPTAFGKREGQTLRRGAIATDPESTASGRAETRAPADAAVEDAAGMASAVEAFDDQGPAREVFPAAKPAQDLRPRRPPAMQVVAEYLAIDARVEAEGTILQSMSASVGDPANEELQRILDLFNAGEAERALELLAEFSKAYPDHPVSIELAELERR